MTAAWYCLIWLPVAILGCVASFCVLSLANSLNPRDLPAWSDLAMNLVPSFICGVVSYYLAAWWGREPAGLRIPPKHLLRAAPLYLIGTALTAFVWANRREKEFGLWAQLVVWPLAATVGGIIGDLLGGGSTVRYRNAGCR